MFDFGMINLDNLEDISSGVDYWTDNLIRFYPDQVFEEWGPEDNRKPYLESFQEDLQPGNVIEIDDDYSVEELTEERAKVAGEFLRQFKDNHTIKIISFKNQELKEKYFSWIENNER